MWDTNYFQLDREYCYDRLVILEGKWRVDGREVVLINIYAPNVLAEQKVLWGELVELRNLLPTN